MSGKTCTKAGRANPRLSLVIFRLLISPKQFIVALKKAHWFKTGRYQAKHALHGYGEPAGCPWARWWHAWIGWHTGCCPRRDRPSRSRWPPGEPWRRSSGIWSHYWSPERSLWPDAGRGSCRSAALWTSGIFWCLWEPQFQAWTCGASSHPRWQGRTCEQPWWPAASWGPCLQWTYGGLLGTSHKDCSVVMMMWRRCKCYITLGSGEGECCMYTSEKRASRVRYCMSWFGMSDNI